MQLSEFITYLRIIKENYGDIEINSALKEYGFEPITYMNIKDLIRFEKVKSRDTSTEKDYLVIGKH